MFHNSSGPFSRKTPRHTNPEKYQLPPREPIDAVIYPIVTSKNVVDGNLKNLYTTPMAGFRNTSYVVSVQLMRTLAAHANMHVLANTFGSDFIGQKKLLEHQTLMYNGLLAGMSFLESHKYALKFGPQPIN